MTRAFSQHKDSVRSAERTPSHPISFAYKTLGSPIATRDALSSLHRVSSAMKEASARVSRPSTPPPSNRNRAKSESSQAQAEPSLARYLRSGACARERAASRNLTRNYVHAYVCISYLLLSRCSGATPSGSVAWSKSPDHRRRMRVPAVVPRCSDIRTIVRRRAGELRSALVSTLQKGKESSEQSSVYHERRGFPPGIGRDRAPALALVVAPPQSSRREFTTGHNHSVDIRAIPWDNERAHRRRITVTRQTRNRVERPGSRHLFLLAIFAFVTRRARNRRQLRGALVIADNFTARRDATRREPANRTGRFPKRSQIRLAMSALRRIAN